MECCGICGSDVPRVFTTGTHNMPCVPGHEFSGTVIRTGSAVDAAWEHRRVSVFPLLPCMKCDSCRAGIYETCTHYDYLGSRCDGAFAEYVRVPAANLIAIPDTVSFEEAAMYEPMAVAVHALRMSGILNNRIRNNDISSPSAAVFGAGTIGLLLVMFLLEAGQKNLYVIGNKRFQKERCIALGLAPERFCDTRFTDAAAFLAEQTDGRGTDFCFDCVGTAPVIALTVDSCAPMGTVTLVGNPASDILLPKELYWKIPRRQLTLHGIWNSSFAIGRHALMDNPCFPEAEAGKENRQNDATDDWQYVSARLSTHRIHPAELITHRLPLADLPKGLSLMRDKTEPYGKIMVSASSLL